MSALAALRFKLMFAWVYLMRVLLPYAAGNNLAAATIKLLHPRLVKQRPAFLCGLNNVLNNSKKAEQALQRHKRLVGVTRFQGSYYAQADMSWITRCQVEVEGAEYIHQFHAQGKGVLVMTYHHHFNMLFCNLLAQQVKLPTTTISMDASKNASYQKFGNRIDRIYGHAEKLLSGGDIILVKPGAAVRPILKAFENNHLVITANDFPDVFSDKNRKNFPFLNTELSCPTGTVKLAVKKQIPIVAGYVNWNGGDRFQLVIKSVSNGEEDLKVKEAMARYLSVLEEFTGKDPGLWEGWKWLAD